MKLISNATRETSLHPICLLSSTDTPTFSLYYSFFLISLENLQEEQGVIFRIPALRDRLDDIESAVKYFVSVLTNVNQDDSFGTFVITASNGSRYFAVWRASQTYLFIGVSVFPLFSFTRRLFTLLGSESKETISPILLTLCEYPIIGAPSLSYDIHLYSGTLTLHFDQLGMVEDEDMNLIASRLFTPQMIYDSWEALILENKVLVISSIPSIVPYCCEFLRRLVLPLVVINTYVPFLPVELLGTIEAPFPYLVGAQSDHIQLHQVDVSETYVVDLDQRRVVPPRICGNVLKLPPSVRAKIIQDINEVRNFPLAHYVQRPFDQMLPHGCGAQSLYSSRKDNSQASHYAHTLNKYSSTLAMTMKCEEQSILECFVQLNLSLFGARYCDIRAFYRRCDRIFAEQGSETAHGFRLPKYKGPDGKNAPMGFSQRNGVFCGCMQLLNERKDIHLLQFLPCWIEFDEIVFSVYQFADEMPLIFILNKDIVAVSPAPVEPEGHVFDLQITNQISFRFAATDVESRRQWIQEIDKKSSSSAPSPSPLSVQTSELESLESHHSTVNDDEVRSLSQFRSKVVQTQMISYFKSKSEFEEYESILNEQSLSAFHLTTRPSYFSNQTTSFGDTTKTETDSSLSRNESASIDRQKMLRRRSSKPPSEIEIMCPDEVIMNLKQLWGLYITGEVELADQEAESQRSSTSQTNDAAKWLDVPLDCREATLSFLSIAPRDYSYLDIIHRKYVQFTNAEKPQASKRETGWAKSFFRSSSLPEASSLSPELLSVKEELNNLLQTELKLRDFAGELLQRISATHRQCEADLRKILVETKMNTLANIIDINGHSSNPGATIIVDIEKVAATIQTDMSLEQRELLHSNCSNNTSWNEILRCWSGCSCPPVLGRQSSHEKKKFDQFVFTQPQISTDSRDDDMKIFDTGYVNTSRVSPRGTNHGNFFLDDGSPLRNSSQGLDLNPTFARPTKQIYKSPEAEIIRLTIKDLIAKQLTTCSANTAPNHAKVLIPVLQGMCGYICGRLPSEAKKAISAYSESALGDQVRIMRCLVSIFLSLAQGNQETDNDGVNTPPSIVDITSTSDAPLEDINKEQQHQPNCENLHLVSCSRVEDFLYWASSIGDIIGLQAVRLITELIHRCLCERMKDRILEQCDILPLQSQSGDRLVSEFNREIAHGIYSRKRLSLSNMQPSFVWVNAAIPKKSETLNEIVVCTMSASKPCELSIQLLNSLREFLKASCQEALDCAVNENFWCHRFPLSDKEREKIKSSSAYRSFEVQSCQLQVSDISSLDENSKILFFSNLYNIMTVHSILARGYSGNGLYDKGNFMKTTKYNVNGVIFNLLEIEHNVLRSQTASPSFVLGLMSSSEKSVYAIQKPIPLISFTLFLACGSSPALNILWDSNSIDTELQRAARNYITIHSRVERSNKTLYLPELFKWYSKDFGGSPKEIIQTVLSLLGKDHFLYEEICQNIDLKKPNLVFIPFDWKFQLVI